MIYLSRVESAFNIPGRGCVIVPVDFTNLELRVRAGDAIQLRGAGECIKATISSIEFYERGALGLPPRLYAFDRHRIGPNPLQC